MGFFGDRPQYTPPPAQPPSPPPNPPMFGEKPSGAAQRQRQRAASEKGVGTVLGGSNPTNTGQKSLLGS